MNVSHDLSLFLAIRKFLTEYLPRVRNCSENTCRSYRTALDQFVSFAATKRGVGLAELSFADFSAETMQSYLANLGTERKCTAKTRNHRLKSIRSFVAYAAADDISVVVMKQSLDRIVLEAETEGTGVRHMTEATVRDLLASPDASTSKGRRDRALLVFMYDTACRVQEAVGVALSDLRLDGSPSVVLTGKGRKSRTVPLMANTVKILRSYVAEFHGNTKDGPLFYTVWNGSRKKMTEDNVRKLFSHYGRRINMREMKTKEGLHPHLMRHSRAMHLYENGMSLELLSQWLGHAQLETTLIYAHADAEMKRKAIEAATPANSPLGMHVKPTAMKLNDDDLIRRLYGLS